MREWPLVGLDSYDEKVQTPAETFFCAILLGEHSVLKCQTVTQVVIPFCDDTRPVNSATSEDLGARSLWKAAWVTVPRPLFGALQAALDPWTLAFYFHNVDRPTIASMLGASTSWLRAAQDFVEHSGGAVDVVSLDRDSFTWLDFPPQEIVTGLRVVPQGTGYIPDGSTVVLDPGLSYGDGRHPTTATCAQAIYDLAQETRPHSLVDVGCGSGILALVAVRVGIRSVIAVDIDPYARHVAANNLLANGVQGEVLGEIPPRRFDVVVANIWLDQLLEVSRSLVAAVEPDGALVVSGIKCEQESRVMACFRAFQLRARYQAHGWSTLVLGRAKRDSAEAHACCRA